MSTIKVDTIATRTGSGNITASNTIAGTSATLSGTLGVTGTSTLSGNATVGGTLGVTSDLTVDGNTLHVDASNNKVGLGVDPGTMPSFVTHAVVVPNGGGIGITSPASGNNRYIYFGTGTSSSDVQLAAIQNTSSDLIFKGASGAEKVRVLNSGGITFNGDTATANALDDYEEGTWTPDIRNADNANTFGTEDGYYTKVGNRVFVQFRSDYGNTGGGGGIQIRNLPFSINHNFSCVGIVAVNGGSMSGNNKQYAVFASSGTTMQIYNGGSISSETYSFLSGSLHYITNS